MKYTIFSVILLILAWKVAGFFTPAIILPPPETVLASIWEQTIDGTLLKSLALTGGRVVIGFTAGLLIGTSSGFLAGINEKFYRLTKPYIAMMQSVPRLSWILIATFWFGLTPTVVIFLVTITVIPYFYVNVSESVRYTDKQMLEVAKIYSIRPFDRFTDIYLPAAMGPIMTASSMALSISWKAVIMAELLSVPDGLGAEMSIAQSNIDMPGILAYTIVVAVMAWVSNTILTNSFDKYFERWKG